MRKIVHVLLSGALVYVFVVACGSVSHWAGSTKDGSVSDGHPGPLTDGLGGSIADGLIAPVSDAFASGTLDVQTVTDCSKGYAEVLYPGRSAAELTRVVVLQSANTNSYSSYLPSSYTYSLGDPQLVFVKDGAIAIICGNVAYLNHPVAPFSVVLPN
jgi:hypothetical protein